MRIKYAFIFLIIYPVLAHAQLPYGYDAVSKMQQQVWMDKKLASADPGYSNVKGTPNIFQEFRTGNFYFSNKTCILDKLINYNCIKDEVLFSDEKNTYTTNSQDIDYFTIGRRNDGTIHLFKQVFLSTEKKQVFMQVLYQEKSLLFKRYRKEFLKADVGQPYGQNRQVDEYNDYYEYYITVDGKEPVLLKPRKSSVIEIFNVKPAIMEDFIKKEKINLKDETDLIRLVKYYDNI